MRNKFKTESENPKFKHGRWRTPEYNSWQSMMSRCYNKKNPRYKDYGYRGIIVFDAWHCFENFLKDMGSRPDGCSLDRFPDFNGNYEPSNCRWATPKEQSNNKRNNKPYPYSDESKKILDFVLSKESATTDEISIATNMNRNEIGRRIKPLLRLGLIKKIDTMNKYLKSDNSNLKSKYQTVSISVYSKPNTQTKPNHGTELL